MLTKYVSRRSSHLLVVIVAAGALKAFYSTASVNELRWILAPTAALSGLVTGTEFTYEPYGGYLSADRTFLIAASCSGVNFLIIAFLVLTLARIFKPGRPAAAWRFLPAALLIAYVATIAANTVRVCTAMYLRDVTEEIGWLSAEQFHRLEGILVYFGFLLVVFYLGELIGPRERRPAGRLPRWVLPLAIYYAATLGLPLAAGIFRAEFAEGFREHFLFVLVLPPLLVLCVVLLGWVREEPIEHSGWSRKNSFL